MSIAAIHASNAYSFAAASSQEYKQLTSALSTNDLAGAQKAFSRLEPDVAPVTGSPSDAVHADLNDPGVALEAGDLRGATEAFARLQTDLSAVQSRNTPSETTVSLLG
jgi:hypothetical protein